MILIIKPVADDSYQELDRIYICTAYDTEKALVLINELDIEGLIHDEGDMAIDVDDPFKIKQIFFN